MKGQHTDRLGVLDNTENSPVLLSAGYAWLRSTTGTSPQLAVTAPPIAPAAKPMAPAFTIRPTQSSGGPSLPPAMASLCR